MSDAEASLRQAQADFERTSQLYENRSVSKAEYDAAYARYTARRARQSQAAVSLSDATLRSPIDGVILRRSGGSRLAGGSRRRRRSRWRTPGSSRSCSAFPT